MHSSIRHIAIGVAAAMVVGMAQAITLSCPLTTSSVQYRATQPWPFDTVELSATWAPACTNFVCLQGAAVVGAVAAVESANVIGFDFYGSDGALPPGVTPQPSSTPSQLKGKAVVGPLPPGSYSVVTRVHMVKADGSIDDCSPQTSPLMVKAAVGPVQVVQAVEFHNATLDHYFVTVNPVEIADLVNGVHPGWTRTGFGFSAFAPAMSGGAGVPACRFYGLPSAGLDSHFYTANPDECAIIPSKFAGAWVLESGDAFEAAPEVPDSFACEAGFVPLYRLWNQRKDSNHRFTTDASVAKLMQAHGYVLEGVDGISMCVPGVR